MKDDELKKPHWDRLVRVLKEMGNGEISLKFQDNLPVRILNVKGEKTNIDLTKDLD